MKMVSSPSVIIQPNSHNSQTAIMPRGVPKYTIAAAARAPGLEMTHGQVKRLEQAYGLGGEFTIQDVKNMIAMDNTVQAEIQAERSRRASSAVLDAAVVAGMSSTVYIFGGGVSSPGPTAFINQTFARATSAAKAAKPHVLRAVCEAWYAYSYASRYVTVDTARKVASAVGTALSRSPVAFAVTTLCAACVVGSMAARSWGRRV